MFSFEKRLLVFILDMLAVASSDATRMHICGVLIESGEGKVTLTATDGHMLLTRTFPQGEMPAGKYFVSQEQARAVRGILKAFGKGFEVIPAIANDAGLQLGNALGMLQIDKYIGQYPDYHKVIPANPVKPASIVFNAEYLLVLATCLKDGEKRGACSVRIVFDPTDPLTPLIIETDRAVQGEYKAVLMPIRDSKSSECAKAFQESDEQEGAA